MHICEKTSCEYAGGYNGCDLDQEQFKGVFVRYLWYFLEHVETAVPATPAGDFELGAALAPTPALKAWVGTQADSIWGSDRDVHDLSEIWIGPYGNPGAIMQTSALDAVLAQSALTA